MITLGFFFLLHPGEYAYTDNLDAAPFRLCDVHLLHDNVHLDALNCPEHLLDYATQLALEFNRQKNGVWGELVRLGRSNHDILCKVRAGINHLKHLRLHRTHPTTPIYKYFHRNTWAPVTTLELTQHLRSTTTILGNQVGIQPADLSVRSLRSNGAMALLCADVDMDKTHLLGSWRLDEMLQYLHVQALPIVAPMANLMVQHGFFFIHP